MTKINLKPLLAINRNMAIALLIATTAPVTTATAHTAMSTYAAAVNAAADDEGNIGIITGVTSIKGIDDIIGMTYDEIKAIAVKEGTFDEQATGKIIFLYNVKTKRFLNAGGFWGTHVSLKDYPLPLWVNTIKGETALQLVQNMDTGEGQQLGWKRVVSVSSDEPDRGVFIDRDDSYGWEFEAVGDMKNSYRIYTYRYQIGTLERRYLCANKGSVDQDKNCEGMEDDAITKNGLQGYDQWRVFTMEQILNLQKLKSDNMTSSLDLSFKLMCPGFSRGNKHIGLWKTCVFGKRTEGGMRFGLEKAYNREPKASSKTFDSGDNFSLLKPYTFNGYKLTSQDDYLRYMAKYFCADAKSIRGAIYQDVKVTKGGSYVIECKGFSNTPKAKLFAVRFDNNYNEVPRTLHQTVLSQTSYMSAAEKEELHINEQNMDYAGKSFYSSYKYINSVLVQVPEPASGECSYIRFGVIVGDNASDTEAQTGEWTVIDDFRLLYASKEIDEDLILDEERADMEYLVSCSNNYRNKVAHLKKTFTRDKWNSFVLPINLTCDQFRQAFGSNAKLAKLSALTSNEIQFSSINMDAKEPTDVVLEAHVPYIIFPTKHFVTKGSPAYKALLTETNGASKSHIVVIDDNHIDIPNVTLATTEDNINVNDLSNIDTEKWTTKKMYSVSGNGTMEAHGTYVRTFAISATQDLDENSETYGRFTFNDRDIIPKRDNLKGSFFFDQGNLYCSTSRVRGLRGFSCWFKPTGGTLVKGMRLYLDGVADGTTTDINTIIDFGDQEPVGKAVKGIYNMNGQFVGHGTDTTGLPAGMYIVNGKKCIVK